MPLNPFGPSTRAWPKRIIATSSARVDLTPSQLKSGACQQTNKRTNQRIWTDPSRFDLIRAGLSWPDSIRAHWLDRLISPSGTPLAWALAPESVIIILSRSGSCCCCCCCWSSWFSCWWPSTSWMKRDPMANLKQQNGPAKNNKCCLQTLIRGTIQQSSNNFASCCSFLATAIAN